MGMNDPGDPANPLQGLLGDLLKMIGSAPGGGTPWMDAAKSLAHGVATDNAPESNADPLARIRLEELARVAELHVAEATGLPVGSGEHPVTFSPVGRGAWALRILDAWQPLIEAMVASQGTPPPMALGALGLDEEAGEGPGLGEILGQFSATMGPVLLGLQFGSAAGHLAQRALGQYALPMPWPPSDELVVVPDNIAVFAGDWSLPVDETQLWVCVRELTAHAVLTRPHVAERIGQLLGDTTKEAVEAQAGLAERLGGGAADPEALQNLLNDPEALLADLLTPGQRRTSAQLLAITTAVGAYVDHVTATVAGTLTGSPAALTEAWYRHRVADAKGEQAAGALFGIDLSREQVDRGAAFATGVLERAGEEGLARLWESARTLPTPAELDAPGLWLERISLPDLDAGPDDPGATPASGGS
jgi:putative hydrolase